MAKLLLVDDESEIRLYLRDVLNEAGHQVVEAESGNQGREILEKSRFDLVLSDLKMPGVSGLDLFNWYKKQKTPSPFVLITGHANLITRDQAEKIGVSELLVKPFDADVLLKSVGSNLLISGITEVIEQADQGVQFFKIGIDDFVSGSQLPCGIYLKINETKYIKVAHSGPDLTAEQLRRFRQYGVTHLYMNQADYEKYLDQSLKISSVIAKSSQIDPIKKKNFIKHTSEMILQKIYVTGIKKEEFDEARLFTESAISVLSTDKDAFSLLELLNTHTDYLYSHSLGVSIYSTMLARQLGWGSPITIYKVSMGGLLHDVGKKEIPEELLNKTRTSHSAKDRAILEQHPTRGMEIIGSIKSIPTDIAIIAGHHHEEITGFGFPNRLTASKIHPLAKLVTISNLFCRYAIKNPDSTGCPAPEALEKIKTFHGKAVSPDLIESFEKLIEQNSS